MFGIGNIPLSDQDEIDGAPRSFDVANEEVEELIATLIGVDTTNIDNKPVVHPNFCRARAGCTEGGMTVPTPTTTPGTSSFPETALMAARSSKELYMIPRTPRKIG